MGHNTLGILPGTRRWREVVDLIDRGAATVSVVSASAAAAEKSLVSAANDQVFVEAVRLMLAIPLAARSTDFGDALRRLNLDIRGQPTLLDLTLAAADRLDEVGRHASNRTDFGDLAGRALNRTLNTFIGDRLPGLFEATTEEVQATARQLSSSVAVPEYCRGFFGYLLSETLSYWLDRTLSTRIGVGQRFESQGDRTMFDRELGQFVSENTRIIKEFSTGWYGKTAYQKGFFDTEDARTFGAVAMKKIVSELRRRQAADA
jgi:hypothetical protein